MTNLDRHTFSGSIFIFMKSIISELNASGRYRTAESYTSTLRSLQTYMKNEDLPFSSIDHMLVKKYENYLSAKGITKNSSSFYLRIFRAVYNRAAENGLNHFTTPHPFSGVYTGIDKTVKRAVSIDTISSIKRLDLTLDPSLGFARDMFMFSFYTRGMSLIDMAYLRKCDVKDGMISYSRRKTGKRLFIKIEKCMTDIINRHNIPASPYLLPIISPSPEPRKQYLNASHLINKKLKKIGEMVSCGTVLTMYVARHSWASVARIKEIPISVISEGMGHSSETITRIYLDSINNYIIDRANLSIIESI